jgi:glutamate-1-semialdehyde 2,1-aminomutase
MDKNCVASSGLLNTARRVLPAGTYGNSTLETIICRGKGSHVWDDRDVEYIDYLLGSGPMLIGHAHPQVVKAIASQIENGSTFFVTNPYGIELARMIVEAVPCAEKVRFASTGSEAGAFAIRLARAFHGRPKILKFEGGYHGYSDYGLISLAPKKVTDAYIPIPDSAGIPDAVQEDVIIAAFNDIDMVARLISENKSSIAAVMMEPFQRNIAPQPGFLEGVRELTRANDILLIFDEVVTGFRMAYGGAQAYYGVTPDICTLGKVVGGGFPLSAIAGREDVMTLFDRANADEKRFVPQIGTLSGNPVAATAGIETLKVLKQPGTYDRLFEVGNHLMRSLDEKLKGAGFDAQVIGCAPFFDAVFAGGKMENYRDTMRSDKRLASRLNALLHKRQLLKGETRYYLSTAHDQNDVWKTLAIWDDAIAELGKSS